MCLCKSNNLWHFHRNKCFSTLAWGHKWMKVTTSFPLSVLSTWVSGSSFLRHRKLCISELFGINRRRRRAGTLAWAVIAAKAKRNSNSINRKSPTRFDWQLISAVSAEHQWWETEKLKKKSKFFEIVYWTEVKPNLLTEIFWQKWLSRSASQGKERTLLWASASCSAQNLYLFIFPPNQLFTGGKPAQSHYPPARLSAEPGLSQAVRLHGQNKAAGVVMQFHHDRQVGGLHRVQACRGNARRSADPTTQTWCSRRSGTARYYARDKLRWRRHSSSAGGVDAVCVHVCDECVCRKCEQGPELIFKGLTCDFAFCCTSWLKNWTSEKRLKSRWNYFSISLDNSPCHDVYLWQASKPQKITLFIFLHLFWTNSGSYNPQPAVFKGDRCCSNIKNN